MGSPDAPPRKKRACDSCHRRKIHCDAALPSCNWCSHHNTTCTFDRLSKVAARKAKKRRTARDDLSERLAQVEDTIARARHTLQLADQANPLSRPPTRSGSPAARGSDLGPTPCTPPGCPFGEIHFAGYSLGQISSYSGIPFFSAEGQEWIESRTGEKPALTSLCGSGPPWQMGYRVDPALLNFQPAPVDVDFGLPSRATVETYVSKYFRSAFRRVFPMLDPLLLKGTLDLAFANPPPEPGSMEPWCARACIFAFLSLVSMLQEEWDIEVEVDGDPFFLKAQYLLPRVLHEISLTGLQTVFLLGVRQLFAGRPQMASMFNALACRIMFMLEGHIFPNLGPESDASRHKFDVDYRSKVHLRNMFWLCYTVDKEISLRTGQPPVIDDDNCDLTLPRGYPDVIYSGRHLDLSDVYNIDSVVLPGDLRLTFIKSKTCKVLYSAKAMRKPDAQLLRDIRELDNDLEDWRQSVPAPFRPTLTVSQDTCTYPNDHLPNHLNMHRIMINIEYHYVMSAIHRASSRCRSWATENSGQMSGINSSLTLSLEASRSTLRYLRIASHKLFGGAFWMIVFYPISAILIIFCHVLMHPLESDSKGDLELLGLAPDLIRNIPKERLSRPEKTQLEMMGEFLVEINRLSNCALATAQRRQV